MANISDDKIDLRRIINAVKRCKWICLAAFVVLMAGSIYFAFTREPKYELYSIMLVEDDQSSGAGALLGGASRNSLMNMLSIGGFGNASIENEMVVVKSHSVMERVVKKLGLNRKYFLNEGFLHKKTLYGNSPVLVVADDGYFDTLTKSLQFKIELKKNGKADVKAVRGFFNTLYEGTDMDLPATVKVDGASFALLPTDYYVEGESLKMNVFLSDVTSTVEELSKKIDIDTYDKKSDALLLAYDDPNMQRGKDILNALVAEYKEHRLKGKSEKAMLGVEFIDRQLKTVYESLVQSEASMEKFKEDNKITNIAVELEVMLEAASKLNEGMLEARAQEMMCDLMLMFLKTEDSKYSLLPTMESGGGGASSGGGTSSGSKSSTSTGGNPLVTQYNALVLQRMRLLRSAKPDNVALTEVTANIDAMRSAVVESVEQQKKNIQAGLSVLDEQYGEFESRLNSTPRLEREYVIHQRDLELNNQIYLFLLGKKVDYQLRQESNSVPATVIDIAYNKENKPSRMKSMAYPIIGLIMSFVFMALYVIYWLHRHQEIEKEYDMPASVDHSLVFDNAVVLRSILFTQCTSKLVPMVYCTSGMAVEGLSAAVLEICEQITNAGKKVLLIDLDDICGGECKLNDISSQADVRPSSFKGIDYLGYHGAMASDMLLNDKFAALTSSLCEKYDKILLLYRYSEDADTASVALNGGNDALVMVYLVKSGYTKRTEIDNIAKSGKNRNKAAYYIY